MCWYSRTEMLRNKTYGKSLHHPRSHTNERISTSNNSELTPQGDRKKRTVNRLCDKRDRASYYFRVLS